MPGVLTQVVILHRLKETGYLPWWEAHILDVVPGQQSADATESHAVKREER